MMLKIGKIRVFSVLCTSINFENLCTGIVKKKYIVEWPARRRGAETTFYSSKVDYKIQSEDQTNAPRQKNLRNAL